MNLPHVNMLAVVFLPKPASNLAGDADWAWNLILYVTGVFFMIVVPRVTCPSDAIATLPLCRTQTIVVECHFSPGFIRK